MAVCNALEYYSLIDAIPSSWRKIQMKDQEYEHQTTFGELIEKNKWANIIYCKMNLNDCRLSQVTLFWVKHFDNIDQRFISKAFININKFSSVVKYRSFQYRLLNNIIYLNNRLIHFGLTNTDQCYFCNQHKETTKHLFYECNVVQVFWNELLKCCNINAKIDCKTVIFNTLNETPERYENLLVLIAKQHIFARKCVKKTLNPQSVIKELEFIRKIEYNKIDTENKERKFQSRWSDEVQGQEERMIDDTVYNYLIQM